MKWGILPEVAAGLAALLFLTWAMWVTFPR